MLTLEHLSLHNGGFGLTADWSIAAGEKIAVIGPSGSGKSTLLLGIAGFLPPSAGRILWSGRDLATILPAGRPMTILFQDHNLFPHLSVAENIALGLSPRLKLAPAQRDAVAQVLLRTGMQGMGARKPDQLSGGQQGRVALARALVRARPILLLDEPFSALGPALKREMLMLVDDVAAATGAAVIMVTHDPNDAKRFSDKVVFVDDGCANAPVKTDALFANPPAALRGYLG